MMMVAVVEGEMSTKHGKRVLLAYNEEIDTHNGGDENIFWCWWWCWYAHTNTFRPCSALVFSKLCSFRLIN